ncbi:hypothetical protein DFS34DRAFT_354924 [Phlyctochytrium arcticum]|nr:hypothetical protein DFS34DRAFT_354924 [Phlyctochytrium arcticum]
MEPEIIQSVATGPEAAAGGGEVPSGVSSAVSSVPNTPPITQAALPIERTVQRPVDTKFDKLRARASSKNWDVDAYTSLLSEAQQRGDPELIRESFEQFLAQFPTSAKHWISYAEFEQKHRALDKLEAIFARCLRQVPVVELWKFYLSYVRRAHSGTNVPPEKKAESRQTILKAFEFVLQNIGTDKDSGSIWAEYIQFLKVGETGSVYEEQQRMDSLRRAYQRAIWIPLNNIEQLWKDYDTFENGLNKLTAKKFMSEKSAGYMTARTVLRELKNMLEPIEKAQKTWMAKPPSWNAKELPILAAWKRLIAWECGNPLHLDDKSAWIARVMFAYRSALLMLRHYPEIHYDAANFLKENGRVDEAVSMLRTGVEIIPTSLLLNFALAELEESRKKDFKELQSIFDNLVSALDKKIEEINTRYDAERDKMMKSLSTSEDGTNADDWDGERREKEREKTKERQKEVESTVEERRRKELGSSKQALSLVWIVYMRTAGRSQNVKALRSVFSRARKSAHCTYHVWVAGALLEHYRNKDTAIAGRMFEVGLKSFTQSEDPESADFIIHYLDFLMHLNDDNNTRALFERALSSLPPERAKPIWQKYFSYEMLYGDLANVLKIDARRKEAYPDEPKNSLNTVADVASRWKFLDIDYIAEVDLGLSAQRNLGVKDISTTANKKRPGKAEAHSNTDDHEGSRKIHSLESSHPERYPRPDMSKWISYKPEAAAPPLGGPPFPLAGSPLPGGSPRVPHAAVGPAHMVPEAIAQLLSILPAAATYNGPILPVNDVLEVFRQIPIPVARAPNMVPYPPMVEQQDRGQVGPRGGNDRSHNRDRRDAPPRRGRGGAGPVGLKRRGAFEDDQPFDAGHGHVNRPPENDIFRVRHQNKRFRDGPVES